MSGSIPASLHSHHDMGGEPAGPIALTEHDYALWEKRVDALMVLVAIKKQRFTLDELRRNVESLGPAAYESLTYYERWIYGIAQSLIQRGDISTDELGRKIAEVQGRSDGIA